MNDSIRDLIQSSVYPGQPMSPDELDAAYGNIYAYAVQQPNFATGVNLTSMDEDEWDQYIVQTYGPHYAATLKSKSQPVGNVQGEAIYSRGGRFYIRPDDSPDIDWDRLPPQYNLANYGVDLPSAVYDYLQERRFIQQQAGTTQLGSEDLAKGGGSVQEGNLFTSQKYLDKLEALMQSGAEDNPTYTTTRGGDIGSTPYFRGNNKGQVRSSGGHWGRSLDDPKLTADLKKILVACLLENYDRLIHDPHGDGGVNTGTLRRAIVEGDMKPNEDYFMSYEFTLANLTREGKEIPVEAKSHKGKKFTTTVWRASNTTWNYGPIVFQGRGSILSDKAMTFVSAKTGGLHRRRMVGPAAPRNIFLLTPEQVGRIDEVLVHGITDNISAFLSRYFV